MQVRAPKWSFADVRPHWAPNREFAQMQNAASTVPAYLEPYLVKVMVKVQGVLDRKHEKLHRELDIFIKQEMQHCKQHIRFNKMLATEGYPELPALEARYKADYERFLEKKSLRFNCAYSEGFEAMSSIAVTNFFEEYDEFYVGADPEAIELWKWHLAEEFEHREVAHDVYHTLFGRNKLLAYIYRLYGFIYAVVHIRGHVKRVAAYLLAKDRETMTPDEVVASKAREIAVNKATAKRAREHLKLILSPNYRPAERVAPGGVMDYLKRYEDVSRAAVPAAA